MAEPVLLYHTMTDNSTDHLLSLFHHQQTDIDKSYNSCMSCLTEEDNVSVDSLIISMRGSAEASLEMAGDYCRACVQSPNPILQAVSVGHVHCLRTLLDCNHNRVRDIDLLCQYGSQGTLAHIAARNGCLEILKLLLNTNKSFLASVNERGATLLHTCASYGHVACLKYLLKLGSSAGARENDGATPVHLAAVAGHLDCLKVLVEDGRAETNVANNNGETPVYFAAQEGQFDCVRYLAEMAGADLHQPSYDGMMPLHAAVQTGNLPITLWLVKSGHCSISSRTSDGATSVHFAAAKGHVAVLEWMLSNNLATGLERDDYGATPVHDAAEHGRLECLHAFYNHGVSLAIQDANGFTPGDLAREKGHVDCVAFFDNPVQHMKKLKKNSAGAMTMDKDQSTGGNEMLNRSFKKRRSFSFLGRIKGTSSNRNHSTSST